MAELSPTFQETSPRSPRGPIGRGAPLRESSATLRSTLFRLILRMLFYPWGIWCAVAVVPRSVRRRAGASLFGRYVALGVHGALYATVGLPLTVLATGEILITANEWAIGEQADYGLQSDFAVGYADARIDLPGSPSSAPEPVSAEAGAEYRDYLVALYSPVVVQKVAHHPEWDIPIAIDFDGNHDPRDNVANEPSHRPHHPVVYGELTAETEDSYYLTYSLYRVKDYDHPLRELLTDWTFHDSDNEGLMLRVDKRTMEIEHVETWFHNRFLLYSRSPSSKGTEPIAGAIHTENGTHPIVYGQSQGHGVRLFQAVDRDALRQNVKILRWRGDQPAIPARADRATQTAVTYDLHSFDAWYAQARTATPSGTPSTGMFEDWIPLGTLPDGEPLRIGRYIAGLDYSKVGWSRPKPPWAWDDGWDRVPIWAWHFLPHVAFSSHSGESLSRHYLYNHPMQMTFGMRPGEIYPHLNVEMALREEPKWEGLEKRGGQLERDVYWRTLEMLAKGYVNYLFRSLG